MRNGSRQHEQARQARRAGQSQQHARRDLLIGSSLVLLLVGIAVLVMSRTRNRRADPDAVRGPNSIAAEDVANMASSEVQTSIEIIDDKSPGISPESATSSGAVPEGRHAHALAAGMEFFPFDFSSGQSLKVRLVPEWRCSPGDADVILNDMRENGVGKVILTVEPMNASGMEAFGRRNIYQVLNKGEIANGGSVTVNIPPLKLPVPAGVFICADNEGSGTCRNKAVVPPNEAFASAVPVNGQRDPARRIPDRIYFFAFTSLEPTGLAIFNQANLSPAEYQGMAALLKSAGVGSEADKTVGATQAINEKLMNFPLKAKNSEIVVSLPKVTPECDLGMKPL